MVSVSVKHAQIDVTPSITRLRDLQITVSPTLGPGDVEAASFFVATDGTVPAELGVDRATLQACGFHGAVGQTLVLPGAEGTVQVAVGIGDPTKVTTTELRDAAATFSRALPHAEPDCPPAGDPQWHRPRRSGPSGGRGCRSRPLPLPCPQRRRHRRAGGDRARRGRRVDRRSRGRCPARPGGCGGDVAGPGSGEDMLQRLP